MVLRFLLLVVLCMSDKSSTFCICVYIYINLKRSIIFITLSSHQMHICISSYILCCCSATKSSLTLWNPMNCSMPSFPVLHYFQEFAQTDVHWVSDATQPSNPVTPFSCPQSFPASGSFPVSWLFTSGCQSIGASPSASFLLMKIQSWFPLALTGLISLQSKELSRVFSSTTLWKHKFFSTQPSLMGFKNFPTSGIFWWSSC